MPPTGRFNLGRAQAEANLMKILQTRTSSAQRSITVDYEGDLTQRYSLFRFDSGDVYWRLDDFRSPRDPNGPPQWVGFGGRLTVPEVIVRLPGHERTVLDWTRKEIDLGTIVADDVFSAMRREEALERLREEMALAVSAPGPRS